MRVKNDELLYSATELRPYEQLCSAFANEGKGLQKEKKSSKYIIFSNTLFLYNIHGISKISPHIRCRYCITMYVGIYTYILATILNIIRYSEITFNSVKYLTSLRTSCIFFYINDWVFFTPRQTHYRLVKMFQIVHFTSCT